MAAVIGKEDSLCLIRLYALPDTTNRRDESRKYDDH